MQEVLIDRIIVNWSMATLLASRLFLYRGQAFCATVPFFALKEAALPCEVMSWSLVLCLLHGSPCTYCTTVVPPQNILQGYNGSFYCTVVPPKQQLRIEEAPVQGQINNQQDLDNIASSLGVRWDIITNTKETSRYEVEVTLSNPSSSTVTLINDAWRLHFYSIYMVEPDLLGSLGHTSIVLPGQQLTVTHVHGSHFYLAPTREFIDLRPGRNRKIKFKIQNWSVARTDSMPNWYLTYSNLLPRVISATRGEGLRFVGDRTRVEQVKRYDYDTYMPLTPQDRFERYHMEDVPTDSKIRLVPKPLMSSVTGDAAAPREVKLDQTWTISYPDALFNEAEYLRDSLNIQFTLVADSAVSDTVSSTGTKVVRLDTGPVTFTADELKNVIGDSGDAYILTVNVETQRISIVGQQASGVFYGVVSLVSLTGRNSSVPEYSITDAPRFEYRGFMLDIARNFHSSREISTLIEVMAMYKLNKLHLHVTDDEGWRLQIAALPELTQIGATQCHDMLETRCLLPELGGDPQQTTEFLSGAEYRSLLELARKRHITIIPEIDMPGHARAAIKSMESRMANRPGSQNMLLTEPGDTSRYLSNQMFSDNALNPCLESAYNFIEIVLDELINLHSQAGQPLEIFHFGGDEVARGAWDNSTACQALRDSGSVPHGSVKAYFVQRVAELAQAKGLSVAAWEDGLMRGSRTPFNRTQYPVNDVFAYCWSNVVDWDALSKTYTLANSGYKVVMTHASHLYFDHPYEPDPEERGYYWATRFTDTLKSFSYNAAQFYDNVKTRLSGKLVTLDERCPTQKQCPALSAPQNIVGMQSTLFSETSRTEAQLQNQVFPRLLAFAERAWHKAEWEEMSDGVEKERKLASDWTKFAQTVSEREFDRLQLLDIHYRIPTPAARLQNGILEVTTEFPGLDVLYSLNNGVTWDTVRPGLRINPQTENILLRTSSKDGNRFSRPVVMSTAPIIRQATQDTLAYIGDNLQVTLTVMDNYAQYGDEFFLGKLQLKNSGDRDIPPGNWRIYFSTLKMFEPEVLLQDKLFENKDVALSLEHIQGPLISLGPSASFTGLRAGREIVMNFKGEGYSVSADDFLPNWYVSAPGLNPHDILSTADEKAFVAPYTGARAHTRTKDDQYGPWSPDWILHFFPSAELSPQNTPPREKYFLFRTGEISESSSPEAYRIQVHAGAQIVEVTSRSDVGAFRAVMTIVHLALKSMPNGSLPECNIVDWPRFDVRAFYLDTARFFMPKTSVFRVLDTMALYKLNQLHFHLSDDESWRLEIPPFPELTKIGSNRCRDLDERGCLLDTLASTKSKQDGQFYTLSEYLEILTYAQRRHIEVIPEFDMPGHARASIRSMLARWQMLSDNGQRMNADQYLLHELVDSTRFTTPQYYTENVVNPCLQSTYTFIRDLYASVRAIYGTASLTLPGLHLGGDDIPEDAWANSTSCQSWLQQGRHLKAYFAETAAQQVSDSQLGLWEDLLFSKDRPRVPIEKQVYLFILLMLLLLLLSLMFLLFLRSQFPNTDVIADVYHSVPEWGSLWRPFTLANAGYKVIMAPASHVFFDHPQEPDPVEGGNVWAARYIDTFKTFSFMPYRYYDNAKTSLSGVDITRDLICQKDNSDCPGLQLPQNIIGLKGVMRTLRIRSEEEFDFQVYPRLLALAERAWHKAPWEDIEEQDQRETGLTSDWAKFAARLGAGDLALLDKLGVLYRLPPPGVRLEDNRLVTNVEFPGLKVQYQIQGKMSQSTWLELTESVTFEDHKQILLRTVSPDGARASRTVKISTRKNQPDAAVSLAGSRMGVLLLAVLVGVAVCWDRR
ncbi:homeobox protein aristaless [Plakobranchus ocellatus]|uniref:beta-N-acetylhexosaminidase n=1 Tax=Plakobranchus ocellatus TaxID=259542 RepID=A0AAV3XVV6_9GAST|nr:homeobox protein aristaless [Plakobranchus ocellatus]